MARKLVIGLNMDYRDGKETQPPFSYVASGYYDLLITSGALPVALPPLVTEEDVHAALDLLDGVVLVGGADLDPRHDGYMVHPSMRLQSPRRECFDRLLARAVAQRKVPVLAIGAGMQLLNVTMGGNLFFHLPEDLPKAVPHYDASDPEHRHILEVVPGTLMYRIYGEGEIRVNSFHHMAVDELAPCFRVSATAPDGVIEAYESILPDWVAIGTQFHPEALSASALDRRIFEDFVEAIAKQKQAQQPELLRMAG